MTRHDSDHEGRARGTAGSLEPALSVRNLTTSFRSGEGWTSVVRNVSFDVMPGETLAVVGESGSGKSVTAMSIMRLLNREKTRIEGEVRFEGKNLLELSDEEMRNVRGNRIAMIFQEAMTSLNPILTIGDQIAEAITLHRPLSRQDARAEALALLRKVRIPAPEQRLDEYAHNFSGGMRQRAMIAMALACKPKVLIADEPTTALDVTIQAQILDLIKQLQDEEGMAVLFITHDMGVVAEIAERTVVMLKGEVVETDRTETIFEQASHPYTRTLLAAVPKLGAMKGGSVPKPFPLIDRTTGSVVEGKEEQGTELPSGEPVLAVRGLTKRFDIYTGLMRRVTSRIHAVEDVSFDLRKGETLSLVGESGCGKSTTGRAVMRLTKPTSGSVRLEGRDMSAMSNEELRSARRAVQMIFQDPFASLSPRRTVGDSIAEPFLTHRLGTEEEARSLTRELLERVGLSADMADRLPHQFSGGQRQRICIARALALSPKVIVADESVAALDVSVKAQVINLLIDLQRTLGVSYLFISHDMAVVERISHRVAVMYLGEIVEIGPREEIFANPRHPYTRKLLEAVPLPDPARRGVRRAVSSDEIKNPMRSADYVPPQRNYDEVGNGHFVLA